MCDDSVRVIPDEQGCGERAQGGVYAECGLSKGGLPLEAFLLDPPQPLPVGVDLVNKPQLWQRVDPLTQEPMLDEAGHAIFDVLLRIGAEHSPWAADDVEETHRLGASRRLHPHPDLSRLSHSSRLLLAHPKAMLTGWRELIPPTRCRKHRPLHDQKHYDAIYRELVEAGEGIDATRDDERGGPCIFKLWEVIPREEACEVYEHEGEYPLCLRRTISLRIPWANPPLGSPCRCRFSRVSACVQASVQGIEKAIITQNGFLSDGERLFAMPNQGLAPRSFPAYLDKEVDFLLDWRRKCRCRHEKRQNV